MPGGEERYYSRAGFTAQRSEWVTDCLTGLPGSNMISILKTAIIIPAYNEEGNLPKLIREIKEKVPAADIIIIDDGSVDNTARVAEKAGALVIQHPFNMGYGAALQTGFIYAL